MKHASNINTVAAKHGVTIPADLVALTETARAIVIPTVNHREAVAAALDALGTKEFEKVVEAQQDALARVNEQYARDVRAGAAARVERAYVTRVGEILDAFRPVLQDAVKVLNAEAHRLPAQVNKRRIIDAPVDDIMRFRQVESAWSTVESIASAMRPLVSGKGNHAPRIASLLVVEFPAPDTLAHGVEVKNAADGKVRGLLSAYQSTESEVDVLAPVALAALGARFALVEDITDVAERAAHLDRLITPKTYKDINSDAGIYDTPRSLVL